MSIIDETLGVDGNALVVILGSIISLCNLFLSNMKLARFLDLNHTNMYLKLCKAPEDLFFVCILIFF